MTKADSSEARKSAAAATSRLVLGMAYAKLTARFGHVPLTRCAAASWTAALLVFAAAQHWSVLLLVPVLTGTSSSIAMPTLTVPVDQAASAERRGTATSQRATALFGSQFGSPLLFGPLIDGTSIAAGALVAATGTAGILIALFRLREPATPAGSDDASGPSGTEAPGYDVPPQGTVRNQT